MDKQEIKKEIEALEKAETSYQNCTKLAVLYIVQSNLMDEEKKMAVHSTDSEFLKAVSNAPADSVMSILDEHMNCIKILYPKEYTAILNKILALKSYS